LNQIIIKQTIYDNRLTERPTHTNTLTYTHTIRPDKHSERRTFTHPCIIIIFVAVILCHTFHWKKNTSIKYIYILLIISHGRWGDIMKGKLLRRREEKDEQESSQTNATHEEDNKQKKSFLPKFRAKLFPYPSFSSLNEWMNEWMLLLLRKRRRWARIG